MGEKSTAGRLACLLEGKRYKPGDLPPEGYLEWHEWADVQRKAGIKQVKCGNCGRWQTPQELSGLVHTSRAKRVGGPRGFTWVMITSPICSKCVRLPW